MSGRPSFHAVAVAADPPTTALDGTRVTELPAGVLDSLPTLLGRLAPLFEHAGAGVVLLDLPAAEQLGYPRSAPRTTGEAQDHPVLTGPRAAGWRVSAVSAWSTFWAPDRPAMHVAVHPWLGGQTGPLLDPDPFEMSWHCHRYHELVGTAYHATPGVTGIGLIRDHCRGRTVPYWTPAHKRLPAGVRQAEADLLWSGEQDPALRYLHSYDANVMYLAAAGVAQLATDELAHTPRARPAGEAKGPGGKSVPLAGYWRIEPPVWAEARIPSPVGWRRPARGRVEPLWVTAPTLLLLDELAEQGATGAPVVLDAWTAPAGRHLRIWAEALSAGLRAARDSSDPHDARQVEAIKATYRETLGMLARDGSRVHRPDWRHAVIGTARANLWRKLWRVAMVENRWPVAVRVDCVTYPSGTRDPVGACPAGIALGDGAGAFKIEGTQEL